MQIVLEPKDALLLTDDPSMAQIHVVSLHSIKKATMAEYLAKYSEYFDYLVAFRPTGWTFQQTHLNKYGHPNVAESDFNPYRKRLDIPIVDERRRLYEYIKTTMKTGYRQPMLLSYELGNQCVPSNFLSTSAKNISEFSKDSLKPLSRTDNVVIFPVPYSEHSSFRELASFICSINVDTIIPTVFSNASRNTNTNTSSGGSGNTGDAQPSAHSHSHKHKHSHKHGHSHSRNNNHNQSYGHGNNYGNMMAIFQLWNLAKTQVEYSRNQFLSMFSELGRPEAFARYFQSHGICGDTEESLPDNQNIGLLFPEKAVLTIPAKANGQYW
ncbi:DNA cross-link repair protein pso2/snm1 [Zancudomyces culisetae]|uniref:DNA cross-link repair protein pso2/snm1 n=1 Tax=Zancudomyces culisetae TaxID=1213189 RepID=A0A1R1PR81_ZANCU|nr:DNA cross-link repair protein pso2/snm1 [Zancudomyces culisetae]|eukprot:OMH83451.1 DNA cross-link repair protein pso2/snm1 [Zancudomyces culisetae]